MVNALLLVLATGLLVIIVRGARTGPAFPALVRGAVAALGALAVFAVLRLLGLTEATPVWPAAVNPGAVVFDLRALRSVALPLLVVAIVEELTRWVAVAPWERRPLRTAALVGIGYAATEHLFFLDLALLPWLTRLFAASALHIALALLLASGSQSSHHRAARAGVVHGTDLLLLAAAVTIHTVYNLAIAMLAAA